METSGIVKNTKSKRRNCGGRITLVEIATKEDDKNFSIPGQHRINKDEQVSLKYETKTGVNWVSEYSILDKDGKPVYSSTTY